MPENEFFNSIQDFCNTRKRLRYTEKSCFFTLAREGIEPHNRVLSVGILLSFARGRI